MAVAAFFWELIKRTAAHKKILEKQFLKKQCSKLATEIIGNLIAYFVVALIGQKIMFLLLVLLMAAGIIVVFFYMSTDDEKIDGMNYLFLFLGLVIVYAMVLWNPISL